MEIFHVSAKIMHASLFEPIKYVSNAEPNYGLGIERSSDNLPTYLTREGVLYHRLYSRAQVPVFGIKPDVLSRLKEKMLPVDRLLEGLECTVAYKVSEYTVHKTVRRAWGWLNWTEIENAKKYVPVAVKIDEPLSDLSYWEYEALLKGKL
jgi:hypothetical protein